MKTIAVSDFKAHALRIIANVARTHEGVVITRRGKPMAQLIRHQSPPGKPVPGRLAHTVVAERDVLSPLGREMWKAAR